MVDNLVARRPTTCSRASTIRSRRPSVLMPCVNVKQTSTGSRYAKRYLKQTVIEVIVAHPQSCHAQMRDIVGSQLDSQITPASHFPAQVAESLKLEKSTHSVNDT